MNGMAGAEGVRKVQDRGDIRICIADSLHYTKKLTQRHKAAILPIFFKSPLNKTNKQKDYQKTNRKHRYKAERQRIDAIELGVAEDS